MHVGEVDRASGNIVPEVHIKHRFHWRPIVLLGKTVPFVLKALQLGVPCDFLAMWEVWARVLCYSGALGA